jgi:peptidoglycan/xylan/chitin deacetylase (PgdA/CDA1 family)
MGWRNTALGAFQKFGGVSLLERWYGRDSLTVLAYHRVVDHTAADFVGFVRNVSASPESFDAQMRMVRSEYNPVSLDDVSAALAGEPLPDRALLVTFDDGYRDNHDDALPILAEYSIPMTVFLATDHIGSDQPFWWDHVAWLFATAGKASFELPLVGPTTWGDPHDAAVLWVAAAKEVSNSERVTAVADLAVALGAPNLGSAFARNHLDWDMVRSMKARGVAFGAHTCSHPILARLEPLEARRQIMASVEKVATEIGTAPAGFAYPNGLPGDFDDDSVSAVGDAGIDLAFTLSSGPARRSEFLGDPLRIPRVYIHHADDIVRFRANCAGIPRLIK